MINHDPNNPRTKNYSIIKSLLRNIEFMRFQNGERLCVCLHQCQYQVTFLDKTGKSLF